MTYEHVKTSNENGVIRVTLNRPPLNVLTIPMMEELISAFLWAEKETGSVVVLDAEGKAFSAGVDIQDHTADKVDKMIEVFDGIFEAMDAVTKPIIGVVNGAALGGGYELVLFCDMVVASEKAKLGQPEIQVGVFPPLACYMLPRLLSWPIAMELILSGDIISAERAGQMGLLNKVLPVDGFAEEAERFIKKFSTLSPVILAMTKKAVKAGLGKDFAGGMKVIDHIYLKELMKTKDASEGLQAFMDKRPPKWEGK